MRNAFSLFFIGTLFTLTIGVGLRYPSGKAPIAQHKANSPVQQVRKTASIMDNPNCFSMVHIFLESQKKTRVFPQLPATFADGAKKVFGAPVRLFKNWVGSVAKGTKYNWEGFLRGGFKIDYSKVTDYRKVYERTLGASREGFESLSPNSLNIDRNPESILGFIYAFNRYERKFHWLEEADLVDLGPFARKKLHGLLGKLLNQKEFTAKEYDDLMQELMWKLFGKKSKELMEGIISQHVEEVTDGKIKEAIKTNVRNAIYEVYIREMSSMALEKTTLFMAINRNRSWWTSMMQSTPAQIIFSGLSWVSLFKGIPVLPWIFDTMPRLGKHKLSHGTIKTLISKGPTKEFFEEASVELSGRYGKDWFSNSLFVTNQNYEKFRVFFQRWVAPALPLIAIYYEYRTLSQEFEQANVEIDTYDALIERFQQTIDMANGLQDFGIVLVDAYVPEEPYQIPEQRVKQLEEVREAHSKRSCRLMKSCLLAKMQQMMDAMDPSEDREMDIEQQMLDSSTDAYKFCDKVRNPEPKCSNEELSIMVHSMIE